LSHFQERCVAPKDREGTAKQSDGIRTAQAQQLSYENARSCLKCEHSTSIVSKGPLAISGWNCTSYTRRFESGV
jgi:hypothetical protein